LSPKFMVPKLRGLTMTPAEGESSLCLPRADFGSGADCILGELKRYA